MSANGGKTCGSKKVYYSQAKARKAMREHKDKYGVRMFFYEYEYCHFYHLSKHDHKRRSYAIEAAGMEWVQ